MRKKINIKIPRIGNKIDLNAIKKFTNAAAEVGGAGVVVKSGNICIDGSSFLGFTTLNLANEIEVDYPTENEEFNNFINNFIKR